jgi:acyl-ACP thioesterase
MSLGKFSKEFEVHYYEINRFAEATPTVILNYLEETAVSHSEAAGVGLAKLKAQGVGWVLNRWFLTMDKFPVWGERVTVETWPSSFDRFLATREFLIKNSAGEVIGRASSRWLYLSLARKRPARIPTEFALSYGINPERVVTEPFPQLDPVKEAAISKAFAVRKSDIDTNQHVNNTKYVEWMLEAVPESIEEDFTLSLLDIEYRKETTFGAVVSSLCVEAARGNGWIEFIHSIEGEQGVHLALARTRWRKR